MSALVDFLVSHRAELAMRIGEHVILVIVSTTLATAIGIPVGILAARRPALARPLVALANLAQTVPSLALFGFLMDRAGLVPALAVLIFGSALSGREFRLIEVAALAIVLTGFSVAVFVWGLGLPYQLLVGH